MRIDVIKVGQLEVNCCLVSDEETSETIIMDPGDDAESIAELIESKGLKPVRIIFTHAHYDHICAFGDLKLRYDIPAAMHEAETATYELSKKQCVAWGFSPDDFPSPDELLSDGDAICAGGVQLRVIHTPGHTPGSVCFYGGGTVFTGDTLFRGSVGRTDLPGGNTERLMESLEKLKSLPEDTVVLCGHDRDSTIGREKRTNPYLTNAFKLRIFP